MIALKNIQKAKRHLLLIKEGKLTKEKAAISLEIATLCCSMAEDSIIELEKKIKNLI